MRIFFFTNVLLYLFSGLPIIAQEVVLPNEGVYTSSESFYDLIKCLSEDTTLLKRKGVLIEDFNPLGPRAQVIRKISYQSESTKSRSTNGGFWIKYEKISYLYRNENIYSIENESGFVKVDIASRKRTLRQAVKVLARLENESTYARNIIRTLQNSENTFILSLASITESYMLLPLPDNRLGFLNNNAYAFQVMERNNLMVGYAPFDRIGSGAEIRWTPRLGIMSLAHELSHAYDANYGLLDDRLMYAYGEVMSAREIRALFHENTIRQEMDKKLRIDANTGRAYLWEGKPFTYPLPALARY